MSSPKSYTQQDIDSKINILKTEKQALESQRKGINQSIREKRSQIAYWTEFDLSQTKLI